MPGRASQLPRPTASRSPHGDAPSAAGIADDDPKTDAVHGRQYRLVLVTTLLASIALAYSDALYGEFVYDDQHDIVDSPQLRSLWPIWRPIARQDLHGGWHVHPRPLATLTFAVNYAWSGLETWSYHATNIGIHMLAALTLFGIVRRTLLLPRCGRTAAEADAGAFVVALLWALHPLQTQAVTYIVQRYESLMAFFYLLTLYAAIRASSSSRPRIWSAVSVGACLAALACKEVAVSAPLIVLLYLRTFVAGSFGEAWRSSGDCCWD